MSLKRHIGPARAAFVRGARFDRGFRFAHNRFHRRVFVRGVGLGWGWGWGWDWDWPYYNYAYDDCYDGDYAWGGGYCGPYGYGYGSYASYGY